MSKLYLLFSHVSLKWKKIFRATHSRLRRINSLFNSNIYKKGFAPESMSRNVTYLSLKAWNTFLSFLNRSKQTIYIYSSMVADESKHRKSNCALTYRKWRVVNKCEKSRMKEKMRTWTLHARVVAHKGWGLFGNYQHENNYKDRHGLLMWLLWSLRIIAFKLYFCSRKDVFKGFLSFRQPSTGAFSVYI